MLYLYFNVYILFFAFSIDVYRYPESEVTNADSSPIKKTEECDDPPPKKCSLEFEVNQGVLLTKATLDNDIIFRESSSILEHTTTTNDNTLEEHCSFVMDETLAYVTMKFLQEDLSKNTTMQTNDTNTNENIDKIARKYISEPAMDKKTLASVIKSEVFLPEIQSTSNPKECIGIDIVSLTNESSSLQVRNMLRMSLVYFYSCTLHDHLLYFLFLSTQMSFNDIIFIEYEKE